ncbi:MAG: polyprenyl synthetase family protein [Thermodesulfobacteriota bacterium]
MKTPLEDFVYLLHSYPHVQGDAAEGDPLCTLETELRAGLHLFWQTADSILAGSGVMLSMPPQDYPALERNFFSALFLYSYSRGGIPGERRVLYAAINQCLRGMVTGCDNLLDDEYKATLETDLPLGSLRFRSVLDIMVSDRVLFEIILGLCSKGEISLEAAGRASAASLRALTRSGAQEASEETGVTRRIPPEEVLERVHHFKTGLLFQSPWAIPAVLESVAPETVSLMETALYRIGMGCQILDDLVDLFPDLRMKRHNYVASLAFRHLSEQDWGSLEGSASEGGDQAASARWYGRFPDLLETAYGTARGFLETGLKALFAEAHAFLVDPAVRFIERRIGVEGMRSR